MTAIFPELPHVLGVYTLTRLLEQREDTELYEARQTHVDRAVVLEVLRPGGSHTEEVAFLALARHRVTTAGIPHVVDVFESLRSDGIWFLTQERPQGRSLADIAEAGEKLSVLLICSVIKAAAEMYSAYQHDGMCAMPLGASSIFVDADAEVQFLSPLVEGEPADPVSQMQATAAALWSVCPENKEQGLGRTVTLLEWLQNGVEGQFLEWSDIRETAATIIDQLKTNARPDSDKNFLERATEQMHRKPQVQRARAFLRQWGTQFCAGIGTVALMSYLGTLFGLGAPETLPASSQAGFMCSHAGKTELVMRYPVSVREYAAFMQEYEQMSDDERRELQAADAEPLAGLAPRGWQQQCEHGDQDAPVTGVSHAQACLYARYKEGNLPAAAQIQAVLAAGGAPVELEWSRTTQDSPLPGIYSGPATLLINAQGKPIPAPAGEWSDSRCGFRLSLPND